MNKAQRLPKIFAKYAGMEIPHEDYEHTLRSGKIFTLQRPTQEGKKLIAEIYKLVVDNGINLRLWIPETAGTMDVQLSRLNMHAPKWIIEDRCHYG